jgi:hypothetical protein
MASMLLLHDDSTYPFTDPWPSSAVDFALSILSVVLEKGTALSLPTLGTADEFWNISVTRCVCGMSVRNVEGEEYSC